MIDELSTIQKSHSSDQAAVENNFLTYVNCTLCANERFFPLFKKDNLNVVRCESCKFVFVSPRLSDSALTIYYENHYHENIRPFSELDQIKWNLLLDKLVNFQSGGRLLEIGCSAGNFLNLAKRRYQVEGVEIADWAVTHARTVHGLKVFSGTVEAGNFSSDIFDVVVATEVIEHLFNPVGFFKEVNRVLKPGGVIFLTTGNIDSLFARIKGEKWWYLTPRYHLSYFSPKIFKNILKNEGFELLFFAGNKGLSFFDILKLVKKYRNKKEWLKDLIARIHLGGFYVGSSMSVLARKR